MKKSIVAGLVGSFFAANVALASGDFLAPNFTVGAGFNSMEWEETVAGANYVTEDGELFEGTISMNNHKNAKEGLLYDLTGRMFSGEVSYLGRDWAGNPVSSETEYSGFGGEFMLGYRMSLNSASSMDVFGGFGTDIWDREIAGAGGATGYTEEFSASYWKLGVGGKTRISGETTVKGKIGMKQLTSVDQDIPSFSASTVPGEGDATVFASLGLDYDLDRYSTIGVEAFIDGMEMDQSPNTTGISNGQPITMFQPASETTNFGMRVNYTW